MKKNSCLYRAVKRVVDYQFGIKDLSSDIFDKYNYGEGIPTSIAASVINEALLEYGVKVSCIYINTDDEIDLPHLVNRNPGWVSTPLIAITGDHAEGYVGSEVCYGAKAAITLSEVSNG